jgi:NADH-quinone oxidoreductase subunit G
VGALTSKPFRYSARTWELSRRKSISPHDSTGANLIVQVKNHRVMRVLPFENEDVNECWIADRDRFSYEALSAPDRLERPMLKQGGEWREVDWQTALEYVANGLQDIEAEHGSASIGALVSPHSTLEELYLAGALVRGLGSGNIDYRLRNAEFDVPAGIRWLGRSIASLSTLDSALIVGSNIRKDQPLFAQRIRQAQRHGGVVCSVNAVQPDWAMPVAHSVVAAPAEWLRALAEIAASVAQMSGGAAPVEGLTPSAASADIARALLQGEQKAILLGNAAAHHSQASRLLALCNWIGEQTGASVGYLTQAANTVGAQWARALPDAGGLHAGQMLSGALKGVLLLNTEPALDSAAGERAVAALAGADMVVTLSPFKTNLDCSDVLLPIAPFTETSGSFVNAEARLQSFHAVVRPLGETRPAWKVLRVLANLMEIPGFEFESSQEVLARIDPGGTALVPADLLSNRSDAVVSDVHGAAHEAPVSAAIYQLDGLVRRAPSLQATRDGRAAFGEVQP